MTIFRKKFLYIKYYIYIICPFRETFCCKTFLIYSLVDFFQGFKHLEKMKIKFHCCFSGGWGDTYLHTCESLTKFWCETTGKTEHQLLPSLHSDLPVSRSLWGLCFKTQSWIFALSILNCKLLILINWITNVGVLYISIFTGCLTTFGNLESLGFGLGCWLFFLN